jgi:hypothetical protein
LETQRWPEAKNERLSAGRGLSMVVCQIGVKLELERFFSGSSAIILARKLFSDFRFQADFLCYCQRFFVQSGKTQQKLLLEIHS